MQKLLLGLGLLVIGCGGGNASGATCPTTSTLTYDNFGRQFFASYCDRCHAAGTMPSYRTVAEIRAGTSLIDSEAAAGPSAVNTLMPESGAAPTEAERRQLGEWLACGAR
ncbi:MAG: hypothetical protein JWM10_4623 [Myxococcaceae bacterium]|nr:hypothetical protein [Myxococcaceae bacterium]